MRYKAQGFTLLEVGVVVMTIGILAAIVAPKFASAKDETKIVAVAEDINSISQALIYFQSNKGYWPADTAPGKVPPEIVALFSQGEELFSTPTPIGGVFDYENIKTNNTVLIIIRSTLTTPAPSIVDAQALDAYLDDGVLNTGNFRATVGGGYAYRFSNR